MADHSGDGCIKKAGTMRFLHHIVYMLRSILKHSPAYFFHSVALMTLYYIQNFVEFTLTIKLIIDAIQYKKPFSGIAIYMIVLFSVLLIKNIYTSWLHSEAIPRALEKFRRGIRGELYEKAAAVDISCYDDPAFYNDFVWSVSEVSTRAESVMQKTSEFIGLLLLLVLTGSLIVSLDPVSFLFVFSALALGITSNLALNRVNHERDVQLHPQRRKQSYYNRVFYLVDYAKEIRLSGVAEKLKRDFLRSGRNIRDIIRRHSWKQVLYTICGQYLSGSLLMNSGYLLYLVYLVTVRQVMDYGMMLALFNASRSFKNSIDRLAAVVPGFHEDALYIEKLRVFQEYAPRVHEAAQPHPVPDKPRSIELRNVSFSYDGECSVLRGVSLTIRQGEKVAIVGYNGAGKTTLVKLLLRLYDPDEGTVLLDGIDIREYGLQDYRRLMGTVFQDFRLFDASLLENVVMDTVDGARERTCARTALDKGGFSERLMSMPGGLDTSLGREFDDNGVNLSGGEAQKVAVSRAFYKNAAFLIMDEPSSALDPISEYNLNHAMLQEAADRTVVFISHRLATTRMADRIVMFEDGQIIDEGSHDTLIARNGQYAHMFHVQAEMYKM